MGVMLSVVLAVSNLSVLWLVYSHLHTKFQTQKLNEFHLNGIECNLDTIKHSFYDINSEIKSHKEELKKLREMISKQNKIMTKNDIAIGSETIKVLKSIGEKSER